MLLISLICNCQLCLLLLLLLPVHQVGCNVTEAQSPQHTSTCIYAGTVHKHIL
jgi:hypothetical protein